MVGPVSGGRTGHGGLGMSDQTWRQNGDEWSVQRWNPMDEQRTHGTLGTSLKFQLEFADF